MAFCIKLLNCIPSYFEKLLRNDLNWDIVKLFYILSLNDIAALTVQNELISSSNLNCETLRLLGVVLNNNILFSDNIYQNFHLLMRTLMKVTKPTGTSPETKLQYPPPIVELHAL